MGKVKRVRVDPANSTRIEIDFAVDRDAPVKTDSVAKISTLGPLTDNYIEITTGSEGRRSGAAGFGAALGGSFRPAAVGRRRAGHAARCTEGAAES